MKAQLDFMLRELTKKYGDLLFGKSVSEINVTVRPDQIKKELFVTIKVNSQLKVTKTVEELLLDPNMTVHAIPQSFLLVYLDRFSNYSDKRMAEGVVDAGKSLSLGNDIWYDVSVEVYWSCVDKF